MKVILKQKTERLDSRAISFAFQSLQELFTWTYHQPSGGQNRIM